MATATKSKPKNAKTKASKPLKGGKGNEPASDEPLIPIPKEEAKRPTLDEWKADVPKIDADGFAVVNVDATNPVILPGGATMAVDGLPVPPNGAETPRVLPFSLDQANAYDSPAALSKWDSETAAECEERRLKRSDLWDKEEASKAAHKADKAAAEEYEKDFFNWLRERREQRGKPPQPQPARLYPDPDAKGEGDKLPNVPAADDEVWKAIPLSELAEKDGFPAYLVEKLANAQRKDDRPCPPITTLGELTAFTEPEPSGYTKKLSDIVGIGAGAVDKICEATERFWERWNKEGRGVPQTVADDDDEVEEIEDDEEEADEAMEDDDEGSDDE